jgi:hypothetical protein
MHCRSLEHR